MKASVKVLVAGSVAAIFAIFAAKEAVTAAFAVRAPAFVRKFDANEPRALAAEFDRAAINALESTQDGQTEDWASASRASLKEGALSAGALRILGFVRSGDKRTADARKLMMLSEKVSRRDLYTQVWLIEDAVGRGDIAQALRHYDRALSVHPEASGQLFPILAGALDALEVRAPLASYVRASRPWAIDFVGFAIDGEASRPFVADLMFRSGGSRAVPAHRPLETYLLANLARTGALGQAADYARQMPGGNSGFLNDFSFTRSTLDPDFRPFTWGIADDLRIDVEFKPDNGLEVVVGPGVSGLAASRVMRLAPGQWTLVQTVTFPSLGAMANTSWSGTCMTAAGEQRIWFQFLPLSAGTKTYRSSFNIPADCEFVRFELVVRGDDSQEDASMILRQVRIVQNGKRSG